ncbi:MAG: hypothetical protein JJ855_18375 [Rhodospirillales bacterium]|nr:hypothetical protein [Rhodospirillales bacterium]
MNRNIKGWTYRIFADDLDSEMFGMFAPLVKLWRGKGGGQGYPSWRDFDIAEDFAGWWGRLSLADILDDPFDIEFALWGTTLTEWWGHDYTRKKMSDVYRNREENWEKFEGPYFRILRDVGGIGFISGDLRALNRGHIVVHGIDLPLIKDGSVRQVLSGYALADETENPIAGAKPLWQV